MIGEGTTLGQVGLPLPRWVLPWVQKAWDLNRPSFSRDGTWKEMVLGRRNVATRSLPPVRRALSWAMAVEVLTCAGGPQVGARMS